MAWRISNLGNYLLIMWCTDKNKRSVYKYEITWRMTTWRKPPSILTISKQPQLERHQTSVGTWLWKHQLDLSCFLCNVVFFISRLSVLQFMVQTKAQRSQKNDFHWFLWALCGLLANSSVILLKQIKKKKKLESFQMFGCLSQLDSYGRCLHHCFYSLATTSLVLCFPTV